MSTKHSRPWIAGGIVLAAVIGGGTLVLRAHTKTAAVSALASPAASPATALQDIAASPVADEGSMPADIAAIVSNFYAAYEAKDASRIAAYFTPDTGSDVFPAAQLFTTAEYSEYPTSFSVVTASSQGTGWVVTVQETRLDAAGTAPLSRTTLLTFIPGAVDNAGWLVASYSYVGASGKYNAFIEE